MMQTWTLQRHHLGVAMVCMALAALCVKSLQEVGGLRLISTFVPLGLLWIYRKSVQHRRLPNPLWLYLLVTCALLPAMSLLDKRAFSIYDVYLAATSLCAFLLLWVAVHGLRKDLRWIGSTYADVVTVLCVLSVFTLEQQWFGGYTLRTFSDFATFFALQVSVGLPFVQGRYRNLKRLICLIALFFAFSRLSFFLSLSVVVVQLYREHPRRFLKLMVPGALVFTGVMYSTSVGSLMLEKMGNIFAAGASSGEVAINASDLGRLAYAAVTLEALSDPVVILFGHGIKTNHVIIAAQLDTTLWGLDESMTDATVHNVYLELVSDLGLVGLLCFLGALTYSATAIARTLGWFSEHSLSLAVFAFSYLFEANYVTFFFQFFVCYFLWVAYQLRCGGTRMPPAIASRAPLAAAQTSIR
jgi:hypothetical protein